MRSSSARSCSRCGDHASYAVAYGDESQAPGRLLVYCSRCRSNVGAQLFISIPLAVFDRGPDGLLTGLYQEGFTRTTPDGVRDVLGVSDGAWSDVARTLIAANNRTAAAGVPELDVARAASPFDRPSPSVVSVAVQRPAGGSRSSHDSQTDGAPEEPARWPSSGDQLARHLDETLLAIVHTAHLSLEGIDRVGSRSPTGTARSRRSRRRTSSCGSWTSSSTSSGKDLASTPWRTSRRRWWSTPATSHGGRASSRRRSSEVFARSLHCSCTSTSGAWRA